MSNVSKAAAVTPPVAGKNTWGFNAVNYGAATYFALPVVWQDCILRFEAQGEDWYFTFGDASLTTVSVTADSTVAANVITVQGNVPYHVPSGSFVDFDMSLVDRNDLARFALIAGAATGGALLRVTRTSGYVR